MASFESPQVQISKQNGQGENTMTIFVQQYMASILRPFADHLDDLRKSAGDLSGAIAAVNVRCDEQQARFPPMEANVSDLEGQLKEVRSTATRNSRELQEAAREILELKAAGARADHERRLLDDRVSALPPVLEELQKSLEASKADVEKLRRDQEGTSTIISRHMEPELRRLDQEIQKVGNNQAQNTENLRLARSFSEGVFKDVGEMRTLWDQNQRSVEMSLVKLGDRISDSTLLANGRDKTLDTTNNRLQVLEQVLVPVKRTSEHLEQTSRNQAEQLERFSKELQELEAASQMQGQDLQRTMAAVGVPQDGSVVSLNDLLRQVKSNVASHDTRFDGYDKLVMSNRERVELLLHRCQDLEEARDRLTDRITQVEALLEEDMEEDPTQPPGPDGKPARRRSSVARRSLAPMMPPVKPVSSLGSLAEELAATPIQLAVQMPSMDADGASSGGKIEKSPSQGGGPAAKLKALEGKFNTHVAESQKTTQILHRVIAGVDSQAQKLEGLQAKLDSTNVVVERLGQGLELSQEYWNGLSRGLQETHRATNELLPKASQREKLPLIGKSPR